MSKLKKTNTKRKTRRNRNKKIMKGGSYTQEQQQQILDAGFTQQFLQLLDRANIGFGLFWSSFQQSGMTSQQYMQQTYDDLELNPDDGFTDVEDNDEDDEQQGGRNKKSKRRKTKKNKTKKQMRRIKGGAMFGNGYGANCNDPNYNIYNTNLLKLFPYSPK